MEHQRGRALPRVFGAALGCLLWFAVSPAARGAAPTFPDPVYPSLRYNDDFTYLAQPGAHTDFWDPLKYIPLGDGPLGPSYLSFGGEVRERFESYLNPNFGIKAPPSNAYLLQRLLLNTDLHLTDYFRAFVQLGEMDRLGNRGVTSTTDIDHLDLMQGFIDLKAPSPLGDAPLVRIGREELSFGYERLVAVREGPNVRRAFDGVRFDDKIDGATLDLIAVRPVNNSEGVFDDHTNMKQELWGGYLTVPVGPVLKADLYWLNYENEVAKFRNLTGVEQRQTFGMRLFGSYAGFDWNDEAAVQTGTFRNQDVRASMAAMVTGYTFASLPWEPRIALEANYASGDNTHSATIGTFDAMYPRLPYFAETSLLVPANIWDVQPVLDFRPMPNMLATFGWDSLWRVSRTDGLYGSGLSEYANTNKVSGMRVGTELFADLRWRIGQHLTLGAIAAEFMSGPAVQEALGRSVTYFVLFVTYKF